MLRLWFCILWLTAASVAQAPVEHTAYGPVVAFGAAASVLATVDISNSPAGATNATGNNLAGARNSTIGNVPGLSYASISVPVSLLAFPRVEYSSPEAGAIVTARPADITGSIQSFSAYSTMADPLALAARKRGTVQPQASGHIYSNTDLKRLQEQSRRTASLPVSTVEIRASAETEAAQARHDRNLGLAVASQDRPQPTGEAPAE